MKQIIEHLLLTFLVKKELCADHISLTVRSLLFNLLFLYHILWWNILTNTQVYFQGFHDRILTPGLDTQPIQTNLFYDNWTTVRYRFPRLFDRNEIDGNIFSWPNFVNNLKNKTLKIYNHFYNKLIFNVTFHFKYWIQP